MTTQPDYAALFRSSPYPYLLIDPAFIIIGVNPAYLQSTGRTAADIVGKNIFDAFPVNPDDPESTNLDEVRISIELAISTKQPHTSALLRYAVPRATPEGTVFDERYWSAMHTPVFDDAGEVIYVSQNAIDVTDLYRFDVTTRKYYLKQDANAVPDVPRLNAPQLHEAMTRILSAERGQLQIMFDQAPGFIAVLTGADHTLELVNQAYYQLVGHRDVIGKPVMQALPELAGQGFDVLLDQVLATGQPVVLRESKVLLQRSPGGPLEDRYVDLLYQPILGDDGRVTGIFAQGSDVTGAYHAHRALSEKIAQLEEARATQAFHQEQLTIADRRKDEFLAMLAHELRNPLAPIGAAADLLQIAQLDEERIRKTSRIIARQVRHMTSLVDDLLDVSRVTSGLIELNMEQLDIGLIAGEAIEQVMPLIRARGHVLAVALAPETTLVTGDRNRLVQVLANLLNNAAKYTPEGGHITLASALHDGHVIIRVIDDGIGMAPDLAVRAFDLFTQAERSSDRSLGGLGLGLALVKNIVGLHGGSVTCTSEGAGHGSTFTVSLPVPAAGAGITPPQDDGAAAAARKAALRILVVDDNIDAAAMLSMLLEASGHEVLVEHDARSALARVEAITPDVFLLDIGLPEMDGNELARRLRARPETAGALMAAITGYGQAQDRADSAAAGFDHHFVKPVDLEKLFMLLEAMPARH